MGLDIEASRPAGYRLKSPLDLLRRRRYCAHCRSVVWPRSASSKCHSASESTSDHLMRMPMPEPRHFRVCMTEYQTGGRGRRGRQWLSPAGRGLCLSVSWRYENVPRDLGALSLATGVGLADALLTLGIPRILLKWPNDIVSEAGKLGGILVDVSGESGGPLKVVVGVGLNVHAAPLLDPVADAGALPAACLTELVAPAAPSRNALAAAAITALHEVFVTFGRDGIEAFLERWRDLDYLQGRSVTIRTGGRTVTGVAKVSLATGRCWSKHSGRLPPCLPVT